jgi:hypothetical protein
MTQRIGNLLTVPEATALGVFDIAEGFRRDNPDGPWVTVRACDAPTNVGDAAPKTQVATNTSENAHFSRALYRLHGGALHRHLGIPEDQPIPLDKKQESAKSDNKHVSAMGRLALAMHGFKK